MERNNNIDWTKVINSAIMLVAILGGLLICGLTGIVRIVWNIG